MSSAVVDACCLIDLLASGCAAEILRASGYRWHLPRAVEREMRYVRQHDPDRECGYREEPADLEPLLASGLLELAEPASQDELAEFVRFARMFRSDGEAMCLALAGSRGWAVASDDRKARRLATKAGLMVVSTPNLLRTWAETNAVERARVRQVLASIEQLARFRPTDDFPESGWWTEVRTGTTP